MILSSTTNSLDGKFGYERAIDILANAGFDAIDISLTKMGQEDCPFNDEDYKEFAAHLVEVAKKKGVYFNQAHAYYHSSYLDEEKTKFAYEKIKKGIEIAALMGVKIIVVHPMQHLYYPEGNTPEILKEMNFEFYNSLLPDCEKYGISIATENMWRTGKISGVIMDSVCSRGPEFCEYIDMMESKWMTGCLDIGHCGLVGQLPQSMIRELGHDRLTSLHVHDNDGKRDNHVEPMAPYLSTVDWEEVCKALAEIDYTGDFTFEAINVFKNANEFTVDILAKKLHDIGRYLIGRIEYYKNEK